MTGSTPILHINVWEYTYQPSIPSGHKTLFQNSPWSVPLFWGSLVATGERTNNPERRLSQWVPFHEWHTSSSLLLSCFGLCSGEFPAGTRRQRLGIFIYSCFCQCSQLEGTSKVTKEAREHWNKPMRLAGNPPAGFGLRRYLKMPTTNDSFRETIFGGWPDWNSEFQWERGFNTKIKLPVQGTTLYLLGRYVSVPWTAQTKAQSRFTTPLILLPQTSTSGIPLLWQVCLVPSLLFFSKICAVALCPYWLLIYMSFQLHDDGFGYLFLHLSVSVLPLRVMLKCLLLAAFIAF